jgi:hypothetical protein
MALKEAVRKLASILDASGVDADDLVADFQAERQRVRPHE